MTNMYPRYLDVFKSRYVLWKESLGNSWNIFTRIQNILRSPIRSWVTKENSTMLLVNTVYASLSTSSRRCIFQKPKGNTNNTKSKEALFKFVETVINLGDTFLCLKCIRLTNDELRLSDKKWKVETKMEADANLVFAKINCHFFGFLTQPLLIRRQRHRRCDQIWRKIIKYF